MSGKVRHISSSGAGAQWLRWIGLLWLILVNVAGGLAQSNSAVSASVQPAQVTVGDSISYQVSVQITGAGQPSVAIPVIDPDTGLSTPSPAGQQSSVETYIENGDFRSVQRIIYSYVIRTSKPGTFTIPPATVTLNGRTHETDPVKVTVLGMPKATNIPKELEGLVVAPNVPGHAELQRKLTGGIFVLPVLSKTDPYNGEQIRISYHLVIDRESLQSANLQTNTTLDGVNIPPMNEFITEELFPFPQDLNFSERKIGGHLYLVAPVYEAVIASTKSGDLNIEPFQISMFFRQTGRQRQVPAPFANDPFFSSMAPLGMFGGNTVQVIAQSPPLTLNVKPLPQAGKPAGFTGAVGNFEIAAEVDKKQARAYDDTIEMNVIVKGEGNTESLSPPDLPQLSGFTVLGSPETDTSGEKSGDSYISSKSFKYTLRPTHAGSTRIPPIELSYFNPRKEVYEKAASDPIAMEILPGSRPAPQATPTPDETDQPEDAPPAEVDLRYISTEKLTSSKHRLAWIWGVWGVVLFAIPPAIAAAAGLTALSRSRAESRQVDPRKQAQVQADQHIRQAKQALDSGNAQEMAAELAEAIRWHFAARLKISTAEATIPEIEDRLTSAGAPPELIQKLTGILETCDSAQYAPAAQLRGDARQIFRDASALLKKSEAYV